jgi:type VI protein secretion system component VasF
MNGKHTPGPWLVADDRPDGDLDIVESGESLRVATVDDEGTSDAQALADAHLIAAAPDLAEVAMKLVRAWAHRNEAGCLAVIAEATNEARAALAAAGIE